MRQKIVRLGAVLLFGIGITSIQAQEVVSTTGGEASGSGGSVSYSVGQVGYTTNAGSNGSVAYGVQQPYEISVVTEIETANAIELSFKAYPNPTTDFLTLKINDDVQTQYIMSLYNINGQLLKTKKIACLPDGMGNSETKVEMLNLTSGTYFVKVLSDNNKEIKTFKIIKN